MMRLFLYLVTLLSLIILGTITVYGMESPNIAYYDVFTQKECFSKQAVWMNNGQALMPIRQFCYIINAKVKWDDSEKKVTIDYENHSLVLFSDGKRGIIDNHKIDSNSYSVLYDGVFYISIKSVGEALGLKVGFIAEATSFFIKEKEIPSSVEEINDSNISILNKQHENSVSRGDMNRPQEGNIMLMKVTKVGSYNQIELFSKGIGDYNYYRITDPDRLVIDIPKDIDLKYGNNPIANSYNLTGELLKSVEWSKFGSNNTQIVVNMNSQLNFEFSKTTDKIVIKLYNMGNSKINYHNKNDRVYLTLDDVLLTEGKKGESKKYSETFLYDLNKYEITFKSDIISKNCIFNINDGYLKNIEFVRKGEYSKLIFSAKEKILYLVVGRSVTNDSAITFIKDSDSHKNIVVIDPGHGGVDPGAIYGNVKEKLLNTEMALELKKLLDAKNIKSYVTRQDDVYLGLYERAYIANKLNAGLFISIHNNACEDTSMNGTETLYYQNSRAQAKLFSEMVQKKMVAKLGFLDRGIVERPELVVTRETKMPSVIAEIGFVTNYSNRLKLIQSETKQNAAAALCEAIIQAIKAFGLKK